MDWLVFGDDWGVHPSTTQHLVRHLPPSDRIVWVNSLGMRSPRPSVADLKRVAGRLRALRRPSGGEPAPANVHVVQPRVLPWHRPFRAVNGLSLRRDVRRALDATGAPSPVALVSNPVALPYLDGLPLRGLVYLRLDDWSRLPGVDPDLVLPLEERLLGRADLVLATARSLLPDRAAATLLPQGVDLAHFAAVPSSPPGTRILGFMGLLAPWLDLDLVRAAAAAAPDWTFELRGPSALSDDEAERLGALPNVRLLPRVPYADLPRAISSWQAAWAPFRVGDETAGVSPLKLREYLAAGLPAASTPLPEALPLAPHVVPVRSAADVRRFLDEVATPDDAAARDSRRAAVAGDGWGSRAGALRDAVEKAIRSP